MELVEEANKSETSQVHQDLQQSGDVLHIMPNETPSDSKSKLPSNKLKRLVFPILVLVLLATAFVSYMTVNPPPLLVNLFQKGELEEPMATSEKSKDIFVQDAFQLKTASEKIKADKDFELDRLVYLVEGSGSINGLSITGDIKLKSDTALIRVILIDENLDEHLVYEGYPLIVNDKNFSVSNVCEESCVLDNVVPSYLRFQLVDASIKLTEINYSTGLQATGSDLETKSKNNKKAQDKLKIGKINENVKEGNMLWMAGETSMSQLTYSEKKSTFGVGDYDEELPNIQGFEYYVGGIFEYKKANNKVLAATSQDTYPENWDWRDRHGATDPTSTYYNGVNGWATPPKHQGYCASCWAFGSISATELTTNLYYNQAINPDLSEQDLVSCSGARPYEDQCVGYSFFALDYIAQSGVVDEGCFPYESSVGSCPDKCKDPSYTVKIGPAKSGDVTTSYVNTILNYQTEDELKEHIVKYGGLSSAIYEWNHSMGLIGYGTVKAGDLIYSGSYETSVIEPDNPLVGKTYWLFKNSYGTNWGEGGYAKIYTEDLWNVSYTNRIETPIEYIQSGIPSEQQAQIQCRDDDNDSYCNWGILAEKPGICPSFCRPEKDCNDFDPNLGPFDDYYNCLSSDQPTPPPATPTPTPTSPPTPTDPPVQSKVVLTGKVYDSMNGEMIKSASVAVSVAGIKGKPQKIATLKTDANGSFSLEIGPGSYDIEISAKDYAKSAKLVAVSNQDVFLQIALDSVKLPKKKK